MAEGVGVYSMYSLQCMGLSSSALDHMFIHFYCPGFPTDVSFAEISCIGAKVGLDELKSKIKEQIDR